MKEAATVLQTSLVGNDPHFSNVQLCSSIATTDLEDTNRLYSHLQQQADGYYQAACSRARNSFWTAQVFAALGITYVGYIGYVCSTGSIATVNQAVFHGFAAVLVSAISSLNFFLYKRSIRQFELFHVCLERLNRYLMANSVSANIEDKEKRETARAELVSTMANAPMLPIENVQEAQRKSKAVPTTAISA
jgi:hypothetical protein